MKCRICQATAVMPYTVREMMFGFKDEFEYFKCEKCGALQIMHVPDNLSKYYPEGLYYSYKKIIGNDTPRDRSLRTWVKNKRNEAQIFGKDGLFGKLARYRPLYRVNNYRKYLTESPVKSIHARVLDIGCGNGWLLCEMADLGFDNLLGIDPFISKDIIYKNGVRVRKCDINDLSLGKYDVIMLNHSLEHMFDQKAVLTRIKELLSMGGICRIEIPVVDSTYWETYRTDWVELDAPRHFCLHTRSSMSILAEQVGLELFKMENVNSSFGIWGSELYQRDISLFDVSTGCIRDVADYFTEQDIRSFEQRAIQAGDNNTASCVGFYLRNCA